MEKPRTYGPILLEDRLPCPLINPRVPCLQRDFSDDWTEQRKDLSWLYRFRSGYKARLKNDGYRTATCPSDQTPVWLERRQQNQTNSIIYQLPEEILAQIRDSADLVTQAVMRRSCGLFLRIVADGDICRSMRGEISMKNVHGSGSLAEDTVCAAATAFTEYKACGACATCATNQARHMMRIFYNSGLLPVWPLPSHPENYSKVHQLQLRVLLDRDSSRRCPGCIAFRSSPAFSLFVQQATRPFHCVDCKESHGNHLFTQEVVQQPYPRRVCIYWAKSVHINLCAHHKIMYQNHAGVWGPFKSRCNKDWLCRSEAHAQGEGMARTRSITPAFKLDAAVPVTREHIRRFLAAQTAESLGQFCPHVRPRDGHLLQPFSPDRCACFPDPPGAAAIHAYGANHPETCYCCRCNKPPSQEQNRFMLWCNTHEYICQICGACYRWFRPPQKKTVYLQCYRNLDQTRPHHNDAYRGGWLRMVDPDMWLTGDRETKHILWCDSPGCDTKRLWRHTFPQNLDAR